MSDVVLNEPNPGKLIESLRFVGYSNTAAIADLVDNSIDAEASYIKIEIEEKEGHIDRIIIYDDGHGMDLKTLDQALRLGSLTEKSSADLGRFGMGLITASISLARSLTVLTLPTEELSEKKPSIFYSYQDIDEITQEKKFVKHQGKMTINEAKNTLDGKFFNHITQKGGTIIILDKCDVFLQGERRSTDNQVMGASVFKNTLLSSLGQTFRKFLSGNNVSPVKMFINDTEVRPVDPLMRELSETRIYSDDVYTVTDKETGVEDNIRIIVSFLPDFENDSNRKRAGINYKNSGFYVIRNNREIGHGGWFGFLAPHHYYQRVRIEIHFSSALDRLMNLDFSKQSIRPSQSILDILQSEILPQVRRLEKLARSDRAETKGKEIDHSGSEKEIANKWKVLINPPVTKERRRPAKKLLEHTEQDLKKEKGGERKPKKQQPTNQGLCEFRHSSLGISGPLYECYKEGRKIIVETNIDHPFWQKVVLDNRDNREITTAVDYLLYAMAAAELLTFSEESAELLMNVKSIISTNLRTLIG